MPKTLSILSRETPQGYHYKLHGMTQYPKEVADLAHRRVRPFLDTHGLQTRTIEHLMCEAYLQGIKDAVAVLTEKDDK